VVGEVEGDAPAGAGRGDGRGGRVDGLEGRVHLVTLRCEARVRVTCAVWRETREGRLAWARVAPGGHPNFIA